MNNNKISNEIFSSVYGLTGSSGSGKTTASEILASMGAHVVSADRISRELSSPDGEAYPEIVSIFGKNFLKQDMTLDFRKLHEHVFSNKESLEILESVLHPLVRSRTIELLNEFVKNESVKKHKRPIFYETPLLFEKNLHKELPFRKIIYISVPREIALERILSRDSLSEKDAIQRLSHQLPDSIKREYADIIIENTGSEDEFREKVSALFNEL
jgi:dephospho-CoA kinase